jgi:hypothetical protein
MKGEQNRMHGMVLMCAVLMVAIVITGVVASKEGKNDIVE